MFENTFLPLKVWYWLKTTAKTILKLFLPKRIWTSIKNILPQSQGDYRVEELFLAEWHSARTKNSNTKKKDVGNGINLIGYLRAATGLGEAVRNLAKTLEFAQVPHALIDFELNVPPNQQLDISLIQAGTNNIRYNINLIHVNPAQMPYLWENQDKDLLASNYNIGFWYWELPEFPDRWLNRFPIVDEIWTASNFTREAFSQKTQLPVFRIPPSIEVPVRSDLSRADFYLPEDKFLFLCAFDVLSSHKRKNPEGAVEAFKRAFQANDPSVGLVVKINNSAERPDLIQELKDSVKGYTNCYFLEEVYDRDQFNSLINLTDVYVSLHRSEGFGLIPAEAMYLGKPAILTNWSGNTDYMTTDNCCGVEFELEPVGPEQWPYPPDQLWAKPNESHAAFWMEKLYSDRAFYQALSEQAKVTIRHNYSKEAVCQSIMHRLTSIGYS